MINSTLNVNNVVALVCLIYLRLNFLCRQSTGNPSSLQKPELNQPPVILSEINNSYTAAPANLSYPPAAVGLPALGLEASPPTYGISCQAPNLNAPPYPSGSGSIPYPNIPQSNAGPYQQPTDLTKPQSTKSKKSPGMNAGKALGYANSLANLGNKISGVFCEDDAED